MDKTEFGSKTAKKGFANEKAICEKFNDWERDKEAQEWLKIMGYKIEKIDSVKAIQVPTRIKKSEIEKFGTSKEVFEDLIRFKKAGTQIRIVIVIGDILKIENLSLKKANSDADYNQVDKRLIDTYQEMWNFDNEIACWLKLFTGENNPKSVVKHVSKRKLKDKRRIFLDEMPKISETRL